MPLGREAVEQLSHGLVVVDISGKILYVNPSFLISTGQSDGSLLLGKDIENVLHMDLHLQDLLEKDGAYLPSIQENTLTREDGSQVFYLMHWGLVRSPAGFPLYVFGVMLDLSGRQDLMEKITNLDNRYRNIVENTPDIIWETGADMRYIYISPAVTKVTGLLPQELLGHCPPGCLIFTWERRRGKCYARNRPPSPLSSSGSTPFGIRMGIKSVSRHVHSQSSHQGESSRGYWVPTGTSPSASRPWKHCGRVRRSTVRSLKNRYLDYSRPHLMAR